jgi:Response regulator containing a CheY-like receiver domain and an HD-GYP domain
MDQTVIDSIYLIDDSDIDLFVQRRLLEISKLATRVVTYNSPVNALKDLGDMVIDEGRNLVLLDLNMPLIDGFDFLDRFNASNAGAKKVKFIVLTSSSSNLDREKANKYDNVIDFISKPLNDKSLMTIRSYYQ